MLRVSICVVSLQRNTNEMKQSTLIKIALLNAVMWVCGYELESNEER